MKSKKKVTVQLLKMRRGDRRAGLNLPYDERLLKAELLQNKGQIVPFLVVVMAVLLLAIVATRLIGEAGFQRIRMANVSDSAVITAASSFCRTLNQVRQLSLGAGGLMVSYVGLQTHLLAKWSTCPCNGVPMYGWPHKAAIYADGYYITSMSRSAQLFDQARKLAEDAPKSLRSGLYDSVLGGALIDEPKPFRLGKDIFIDDKTGKVEWINYDSYSSQDYKSNLQVAFHDFKKGDWYNKPVISYSWNKSKKGFSSRPGTMCAGDPDRSYEADLRVEALDVPESVIITPQIMPMVYFYLKPHCAEKPPYCTTQVGITVHPWAWISSINIDKKSFGLDVRKRIPFRALPFFANDINKEVSLKHKNRIHIQGNVWSGFEPKMEE